jgi:hypothetical protein
MLTASTVKPNPTPTPTAKSIISGQVAAWVRASRPTRHHPLRPRQQPARVDAVAQQAAAHPGHHLHQGFQADGRDRHGRGHAQFAEVARGQADGRHPAQQVGEIGGQDHPELRGADRFLHRPVGGRAIDLGVGRRGLDILGHGLVGLDGGGFQPGATADQGGAQGADHDRGDRLGPPVGPPAAVRAAMPVTAIQGPATPPSEPMVK